MANEHSIKEDPETSTAPWDTVSFTQGRPTVPDTNGNERPLTDYEMRMPRYGCPVARSGRMILPAAWAAFHGRV
jgi:hypothetical protein